MDFSFQNHGPFKDKTTISMMRFADQEKSENLLECEALNDTLLNSCVIAGPNASGKSNVIKAVSALKNMVSEPLPEGAIHTWYSPFRFSPVHSDSPTIMDVRFTEGTTLYHYSISFDAEVVVSESLSMYNNGRKEPVFHRNGDRYSFGRSRSKGQKAISMATSSSSSYLAVASRFNNIPCSVVHRFITHGIIIVGKEPDYDILKNADSRMRQKVIRIMDITDFGSVSITDDSTHGHDPFRSDGMSRIRHWRNLGEHDNPISKGLHDFDSAGSREMLSLSVPLVRSLEEGHVLMVDEFGSNLHPDVCKWIIRQFRNLCNPKRAQLLFVTNHPEIIERKGLFRRDQIYYTRRDGFSGSSELFAVSDYEGNDTVQVQSLPFIPGENIMD